MILFSLIIPFSISTGYILFKPLSTFPLPDTRDFLICKPSTYHQRVFFNKLSGEAKEKVSYNRGSSLRLHVLPKTTVIRLALQQQQWNNLHQGQRLLFQQHDFGIDPLILQVSLPASGTSFSNFPFSWYFCQSLHYRLCFACCKRSTLFRLQSSELFPSVDILFFLSIIQFFLLWQLQPPTSKCLLDILPRMSSQAPAAAKSLQSCLTLCDPIDGSPPGSPVPGILQTRTFPSPSSTCLKSTILHHHPSLEQIYSSSYIVYLDEFYSPALKSES